MCGVRAASDLPARAQERTSSLFDIGVQARRMRLRTATGPESVVSSTGAMVSMSRAWRGVSGAR
jgi:hypothetical protein